MTNKLRKLRHERYELICQLQSLIASISKEGELKESKGNPEFIKQPLTWMISGVKTPEGIIIDTNTNPLHQKLMEIYYKEQEIDDEQHERTKKFLNTKFKGLRKRIYQLERSNKGLNERMTHVLKEFNRIKEGAKVNEIEKEKKVKELAKKGKEDYLEWVDAELADEERLRETIKVTLQLGSILESISRILEREAGD